jgi:hypothetical protein
VCRLVAGHIAPHRRRRLPAASREVGCGRCRGSGSGKEDWLGCHWGGNSETTFKHVRSVVLVGIEQGPEAARGSLLRLRLRPLVWAVLPPDTDEDEGDVDTVPPTLEPTNSPRTRTVPHRRCPSAAAESTKIGSAGGGSSSSLGPARDARPRNTTQPMPCHSFSQSSPIGPTRTVPNGGSFTNQRGNRTALEMSLKQVSSLDWKLLVAPSSSRV